MAEQSEATNRPEPAFVDQALADARINALRLALYQETRDPELAAMVVVPRQDRGGAMTAYTLNPADADIVRAKAKEYILSGAPRRTAPTKSEAAKLLQLFCGREMTPPEIDYGFEELAFEGFPRQASWNRPPDPKRLADFSVVIVGAGISGIMAAIQLSALGIKYRIIERNPDIGGTWHVNDYPEARVDVSTFLYQFKFERGYKWKNYYATQGEIKEYLKFVADKYGITPNICFDTSVTDARWDDECKRWSIAVQGASGREEVLSANAVISAVGLFNAAQKPNIPGIELYEGALFHTTEWDHGVSLQNKSVALIGTGSTGTQLAHAVARDADRLTVYQRTPNWVTPVQGYHKPIEPHTSWLLLNMPNYAAWVAYGVHFAELQLQEFHDLDYEWIAKGGRVSQKNAALADGLRAFIRSKVVDDALYEKLVPTHPPLSRRLVIDNGWYETLLRDDVELVAGEIKRVTPQGIIGSDGVERHHDLIITAAGFSVSRYLFPVSYTGRDGVDLERLWSVDGPRAFKGTTLPGFPNLFVIYGPNAQARAGSFHAWAEVLTRYICDLIVHLIEGNGSTVEVKRAAYDAYNADLDSALKGMLWETEGADGYYVGDNGRAVVIMPWRLDDFYQQVQAADLENYTIG